MPSVSVIYASGRPFDRRSMISGRPCSA